MKKTIKFLCMILALVFVMSALAACQNPDDPTETDPTETDPIETDPTETDPTETDPIETDPPKDPLQLTEGMADLLRTYAEEARLLAPNDDDE